MKSTVNNFSIRNFFQFQKLDWLLIKSFLGPFVLTFLLTLFVLIMQFLWKYIDDLVGKGLTTGILLEFIFYASARLVPMALPLAVLLASIMTFGALGEHMELTALKSAGVSLLRLFKPLIFTVSLISIFAFFFSNNVMPLANLKFATLYHDICSQKPTMFLKEGIFYNELEGFNLRIGHKAEDGTLYDILVYDHSSGQGDDHVITAKKGSMKEDEHSLALTLYLEDGKDYKDIKPTDEKNRQFEMYHTKFKSWSKKFDLSKFKLARSDENFFKDVKAMLTLSQLVEELDTIKLEKEKIENGLHDYVKPYFGNLKNEGIILPKDTSKNTNFTISSFKNTEQMLGGFDAKEKIKHFQRAQTQARNVKNYVNIVLQQTDQKDQTTLEFIIEIYKKFTLSIACLVLFFIGAPLGSIIRKGGLGWPLFYAVLFFIIYHVLTIVGEKMAEKKSVGIFTGVWMATYILLPIGIFLTQKAANDSKLFNADAYIAFFKQIYYRFLTKKTNHVPNISN